MTIYDSTVIVGTWTNPTIELNAQGQVTAVESGNASPSDVITVGNDSAINPGSYQLVPGANIFFTPVVGPPNTLAISSTGGGGGGGTVTQVNTGTGLTGGPVITTGTISIANTAVIPASYTNANITVNAQGQITTASNGTSGTVTSVGTDATLTGGPITGAGTLGLASQGNNTVLGNVSGSSAQPIALSKTQLTTQVNAFTNTLSGATPSSGGGTTNYLRADGSWAAPAGTVTSVANSDSTLTVSPTTGSVVASLNLGHANTWTGAQTFNSGIVIGTQKIVATTEYDNGNSGTSITIDFNNGNQQKLTLTGNCTISFTAPAAGVTSIRLEIVQGAGGPYTIAWPVGTKWAGGIKPPTATAAAIDIAAIEYSTIATNYFGVASLNFI